MPSSELVLFYDGGRENRLQSTGILIIDFLFSTIYPFAVPGSIIGELILQPILEFIFQVVAYHIGSFVVPIISLGRWKCDGLLRDVPKKKLKWGGFCHRRGKQLYVTAEGTAVVGLLFSMAVIAVIVWMQIA